MAYAWQRQGLLDNTPSWAGSGYQAQNDAWYRRMAPAPLLPLPEVTPPAPEQPAGLLAPEGMPEERQTWADRQADPYNPAGSAVQANGWLDALATMAGGAMSAMGPMGGAGIIGNLVASDAMGLRPSISTLDTARQAMGGSDRGMMATQPPPRSAMRIERTSSQPVDRQVAQAGERTGMQPKMAEVDRVLTEAFGRERKGKK